MRVLPVSVGTLRTQLQLGQTYEYRLFYGHHARPGTVTDACFSQWWPSPFTLGIVTYPTAEHWMMVAKARLFDDAETANLILLSTDPAEAKRRGRQVRHFDDQVWARERARIVLEGNRAKFEQNPALAEHLLSTGDAILAEASPTDCIWGLGFDRQHRHALDPMHWRGLNLLGFALMQVRAELRSAAPEKPEEPEVTEGERATRAR